MGLLRVMMPPKLQLLALLAFAVAMFFLENQIQKLEESRGKLGELNGCSCRGSGFRLGHNLLNLLPWKKQIVSCLTDAWPLVLCQNVRNLHRKSTPEIC